MPARDFTDYIALVYGAGERAYDTAHVRQLKRDRPVSAVKSNGHLYDLQKDRANPITGWTPWRKWYWLHPIRSLFEMFRSKKVGLLEYQEPCTRNCVSCPDQGNCINIPTKIPPIHISRMHQPSGIILSRGEKPQSDSRDLIDTVTPRTLKALVDSPQFRRAYRSFKFGELTTKVTSRWWLVIAIVAVVITLFILLGTGIVSFPR